MKIYTIENLGCANCAAKIEDRISKLDGVTDVSLDLMGKKLYLNEDADVTAEFLTDLAEKIESGVVIKNQVTKVNCTNASSNTHHHGESCKHEHGTNSNRVLMIRLFVSLTLFIISVLAIDVDSIISSIMLGVAFIIVGYDIFLRVPNNIKNGQFFDENLLMMIASTGAMIIGEMPEGVAVLIFYQLGEFLQHKAVDQSRRSIASQMDLRSERVLLLKDNQEILTDPQNLYPDDIILLKAHQLLPVDAEVIKGTSFMNTASITGESKPMQVNQGSEALSGFVNGDSELRLKVTAPYAESTTAKIIELVEHASSKKARAEQFITKFARVYTPIVVGLAAMVALLPPLILGGEWPTWVYRGLIFLVVSCPCALVLSIPLGFFAGLGAAAKSGIVVKGGNYLERLADINTFVFDKTGTLTDGQFRVTKTNPVAIDENTLLALAKFIEAKSAHPIARAITETQLLDGLDRSGTDNLVIDDFTEVPGRGIIVIASENGKDNQDTYFAGSQTLMADQGIVVESADSGDTRIYIAKNKTYLGSICLADTVKATSFELIKQLKHLGIKHFSVVSGDKQSVVSMVAEKLNITSYFGNAMPKDKLNVITDYIEKEHRCVAFVGDGSNDAPVLARADVGIAMGGVGTDVALEAADMMIMEDDLLALPKVIKISKKTKRIIYQNIAFALGFKILVMVLSVLGLANMWLAVFADVGVAILAVFNSLRILR